MFPLMPRITKFRMMITMPFDISMTKEGKPSEKMPPMRLKSGLHFCRRNEFFLRIKCRDSTAMLRIGAIPVASAAPNIPMPSGKIKT